MFSNHIMRQYIRAAKKSVPQPVITALVILVAVFIHTSAHAATCTGPCFWVSAGDFSTTLTTEAEAVNGTSVSWSGSEGEFTNINLNANIGSAPSFVGPNMTSTVTATSAGLSNTDTMTIFVTAQNLNAATPLTASSIIAALAASNFVIPAATVAETVWLDPGNNIWANTFGTTAVPVLTKTFTCCSNASSTDVVTNMGLTLSGLYSETEEFQITGTSLNNDQGTVSASIETTETPLPPSLSLFCGGLLLMGAVGAYHKRKTAPLTKA